VLGVLAGILFTLGAVAFSALPATAAPAHSAAAAHSTVAVSALRAAAAPAHGTVAPRNLTSSWVVYSGTSFTGRAIDIHGCGTHNRPYPVNSYKWFARGQSGRMYNCFNAACAVNFVLPSNSNAEQSTPVGWRSIFIVC